jgi:hypothetical protein
MPVEETQPESHRNAEIDFREFFSLSNQNAPPAHDQLPPLVAGLLQPETREKSRPTPRIGWAAAANITFAAIALVGGLFCSFYFFNSAEPPRVTSVFPLKLNYQRPFALTRDLTIDKFNSVHIQPWKERAFDNSNPSRANVTSPSVQPQLEPSRPEKSSAFIPPANFTPNLSSPRFNQTARGATSSSVANRASTSASSTKTSEAKGKARLSQTKQTRALRNIGVRTRGLAQHTKATITKVNRNAQDHRHSAQFERARQAMDRGKPPRDFSPRTTGTPSGLSFNPGSSSFRMSRNLSRGSH